MEKTQARTFVDEVSALPGGEGIRICIQCGTCTASCPGADRWEYTPARVIAMIRAGMRKEVLSSGAVWHCLSCYSCTVRCPRGVKPTDLFHALEYLAYREGFVGRDARTPAMYRSFVKSIKENGRVHEFGMMRDFYMATGPFSALKSLPTGVGMFSHERLHIQPKKIKGINDLNRIIAKFHEVRGGK